jgi:hypothetical protein
VDAGNGNNSVILRTAIACSFEILKYPPLKDAENLKNNIHCYLQRSTHLHGFPYIPVIKQTSSAILRLASPDYHPN